MPVLHAQLPLLQQLFVLGFLEAQHVVAGQQIAVLPVPQHFEGLGQVVLEHDAAKSGFAATTPMTAAASVAPTNRKAFRRGMGVASSFARSSKNWSIGPVSAEFRERRISRPYGRICPKNDLSGR